MRVAKLRWLLVYPSQKRKCFVAFFFLACSELFFSFIFFFFFFFFLANCRL